jgi:hypothetical protein
MSGHGDLVRSARLGAEDRQRALDEVCRSALRGFVGRELTPALLAEAEGIMRAAVDEAVRDGKYVLPDGLVVDRVELGQDMRIKVFFGRPGRLFGPVEDVSDDEDDGLATLDDLAADKFQDLMDAAGVRCRRLE